MTHPVLVNDGWSKVARFLPEGWTQWAVEHGLCDNRGTVGGEERAKLRDPAVQLRLILHPVGCDASLEQTVTEAAAAGLVDVSAVALSYRMRTAAPWLAQILEALLDRPALAETPALWRRFGRIFCTDGSSIQRQGAAGTTARIHYRLHLASLLPEQILVPDVHTGERLRNFTIQAGDLDLLDRGYCTAADIAHARSAGGDVLVRYTRTTLPLFDRTGQKLSSEAIVTWVRQKAKRSGRVKVRRLWVHPEGAAPIAVRLCAMRLDAAGAAQAQARLRREYATKDITEDDLAWCHYVVVVTTVPAARLTGAEAIELYRQRGQVELQIKRDKSLGKLGRLPSFRDDAIRTWLLAKLIVLALCRKVAEGELSPPEHAADIQRAA